MLLSRRIVWSLGDMALSHKIGIVIGFTDDKIIVEYSNPLTESIELREHDPIGLRRVTLEGGYLETSEWVTTGCRGGKHTLCPGEEHPEARWTILCICACHNPKGQPHSLVVQA